MTRGDILTKAIAIAKRNGFGVSDEFFTDTPVEAWLQEGQDLYFSLVFCHDFCICFFGENLMVIDDYSDNPENIDLSDLESPVGFLMANRKNIQVAAWQYHLAQMALSFDPLEYLSKFVQDYEQSELN